MDVYKIIREAKDTEKLLDSESIDFLFNPISCKVMFTIINNDENKLDNEISEFLLKKREDYKLSKHNDELDNFVKDINSGLKKILKSNKHEKINEFIEQIKNKSERFQNITKEINDNPNSILFRLFINEYNTKSIFTWKNFKDIKKQFEKNHPLEGENIYNLKSFLEKNSTIEKIDNNTIFSKEQHTLPDKCIEKMLEKIN